MLGVDWADVSGWGAFGALASVILTLVLTGQLVPRRTHKDTMAERNIWREAALTALTTGKKSVEVLTDARQAMQASTTLIQALPIQAPEAATDDDDEEH